MTYFSCVLLLLSYLFCSHIYITLILNHSSNDCMSIGFILNLSLPRLYSSLQCLICELPLVWRPQPFWGKGMRDSRNPTQTPADNPYPLSLFWVNSQARSLHQSSEMRWGAWGGRFLPREPLFPWGFKGGKAAGALTEEDPFSASSAITVVSVLLVFGSVIFFSPDCTLWEVKEWLSEGMRGEAKRRLKDAQWPLHHLPHSQVKASGIPWSGSGWGGFLLCRQLLLVFFLLSSLVPPSLILKECLGTQASLIL